MKYVIYARKSSEGKKRQALSIPAQIRAMREVADRGNLKIIKIFKESKSAKEPGREIFGEMMKYITDGKADGVLCWKMDRLSRNPIDEGSIKYYLETGIIKMIRTPDRTFDSQENSVVTGIEFSMASQYSRDLSKNVKRGNREKLKRGWWPSSAPFGYLNSRGLKPIIQDSERAQLLKYAFERYAQGDVSIKELNEDLYNQGLRTKGNKKLTVSALHHKLQNPFYYGLMIRNGESFQGKHEPIISKELFGEVQNVRLGKNKKRGYKRFFPFRGMLSCDSCGCALTADKQGGHDYYYCTNGKGKCDAHKKYMRSETVEDEIADSLQDLHFTKETIDLMYKASLQRVNKTKQNDKYKKERLKKLLTECIKKQDSLMDNHALGKTPDRIYERRIKELEQEQIDLEREIDKKISYDKHSFEQTKKVFLRANKAKEELKKRTDDKKQELLQNLLSNIVFDGQEVSKIQYKKGYQLIANAPKNAKIDVLLAW